MEVDGGLDTHSLIITPTSVMCYTPSFAEYGVQAIDQILYLVFHKVMVFQSSSKFVVNIDAEGGCKLVVCFVRFLK